MKLSPDVPTTVVLVHLAALAVLLLHVAVTWLRRFVLIRECRDLPSTFWSHLLHILLGLPR